MKRLLSSLMLLIPLTAYSQGGDLTDIGDPIASDITAAFEVTIVVPASTRITISNNVSAILLQNFDQQVGEQPFIGTPSLRFETNVPISVRFEATRLTEVGGTETFNGNSDFTIVGPDTTFVQDLTFESPALGNFGGLTQSLPARTDTTFTSSGTFSADLLNTLGNRTYSSTITAIVTAI